MSQVYSCSSVNAYYVGIKRAVNTAKFVSAASFFGPITDKSSSCPPAPENVETFLVRRCEQRVLCLVIPGEYDSMGLALVRLPASKVSIFCRQPIARNHMLPTVLDVEEAAPIACSAMPASPQHDF